MVLTLVTCRLCLKYSVQAFHAVLLNWKPTYRVIACIFFPWSSEHRGKEKVESCMLGCNPQLESTADPVV